MNKFVKVLLIVAACLAGLGVLLTSFGVFWSVRVADRLLPDEAVPQNVAVDVASLKHLKLETGVSDLCFETAPIGEARVETAGFSEGEVKIEQKDGTLSVCSRNMLGGDIINVGLFRIDWLGRIHTGTLQQRTVTVYLPQTALESFELTAGVGDVSGSLPFTAQRMDVSCGTGCVTLSHLHAQQLSVSRGVGDIKLTDFSCETFDLTGGTGNAVLTDGGASVRSSLSVGVGDVTVSGGQWNAMSVSGGTGNFTFDGSMRDACSINGGVGDVELHFADGVQNYRMELHKGLGDIDAEGVALVMTHGDKTYAINPDSTAENRLTIEQVVGNVRLRFTEE